MEDADLPRIFITAVDTFLEAFKGTEKEMKNLFLVWDTTADVDYRNLERKMNQTARELLEKEPGRLIWINLQ